MADVRTHRTTKRRPLDAHAEEQPHLLSLPSHHYDTAKVVYRVVDSEGYINYGNNQYSVPWQLVGELLPVRVTEDQLFVYDRRIKQLAKHLLIVGQTRKKQQDPAHRPPRNRQQQVEQLRKQFTRLGEVAKEFLEGLLKRQRYGLKQAQRVLALLRLYERADVLAAMERAVRHHAYSFSSLERILSLGATPKSLWLSESQQEWIANLTEDDSIEPRSSADYQHLLFEETDSNESTKQERPNITESGSESPGDSEDSDEDRAAG